MRLGLIARADKTGLGYQTKGFYDHLKPDKTMVVDISELNGRTQHYGWYPDATFVRGFPQKADMTEFLQDIDVVLTAETPYNYEFYTLAKSMGVKFANQYNAEFFDHFIHNYPLPDLFIAPSMWKFDEIDEFCKRNGVKHQYIHYPIDRAEFPFIERHTIKTMHLAGRPAAHDRNGTWDYMTAVPDGRVVTQDEAFARQIRNRYRHSNVWTNATTPQEIYIHGDIMVLPRRYGGNCLPLNEALSTGMPVIMPDIIPNSNLLPKEWLVPANIVGSFTPRTKVDLWSVDIVALADKIAEASSWNMAEEQDKADRIANSISWTTLKPVYLETLKGLLK